MPVVLVNWLTAQLLEHESARCVSEAEVKWWKHPAGFNYLFAPGDDDEMFPMASGPPPGFERLPFHVEEPDGE